MTQQYVPEPLLDLVTATARLEKSKVAYLEQRAALEEKHNELTELRTTLASHRKQAEAANQQAEEAIRAARGQETEEIVGLQEMATRKERQIRVVESMVAALEPTVELLQIETYGKRITYTSALSEARLAANHEATHQAAKGLATGEAGIALAKALPLLSRRAEDQLYGNALYMAARGVRNSTGTPEEGRASLPFVGNDEMGQLTADLRMRRMAALGELITMYLPKIDDSQIPNEIQEISTLACESSAKEMPNGLALARRRQELQALAAKRAA